MCRRMKIMNRTPSFVYTCPGHGSPPRNEHALPRTSSHQDCGRASSIDQLPRTPPEQLSRVSGASHATAAPSEFDPSPSAKLRHLTAQDHHSERNHALTTSSHSSSASPQVPPSEPQNATRSMQTEFREMQSCDTQLHLHDLQASLVQHKDQVQRGHKHHGN